MFLLKSSRKIMLVLSVLIFQIEFTIAQNPIVAENLLPGNPSTEWDVIGAGDISIQGFATDISVEKGDTVHFKIDVAIPSTSYRIKIYRLGYYQGNGARLIQDLGDFAGTPQPLINADPVTGLTDCNSWSESATWNVPVDAVSGLYIVKLTRADNNGSSHIVFIVRDDSGNSPLLFKTSDATWQAYNRYRYHSLYTGPVGVFSHAVKVSYNRPFYTRDGQGGGNGTKDWLFNAEYPMIRWLERNGYDVSYSTDVDMDRDSTLITPAKHKILLSVGHDEYWSAAERAKFVNARDAGVHLAFFSGNEVYWKTRWEDNYRTLVCYKEGTLGENSCGGKCDPQAGVWTGLWRDGCTPAYAANDGCLPESQLSGQMSWNSTPGSIVVPTTFKDLGFWRHTSIAALSSGQAVILPSGTLGDEWDAYDYQYASTYPEHRIVFSSTYLNGATHNLSLYRAASGALVFGAGTLQWSWGLDENHDNGNNPPSADMQQATVNILADMGVMPSTIQSGLIASTTSDNQPPATTITSPADNAILPGKIMMITGTCVDAGGGVVTGVEISIDGGGSWHPVNGTVNWTYVWQPPVSGTYNIIVRGWDDLCNLEVPGSQGNLNSITITIAGAIYNSLFQLSMPSGPTINNIGNGITPLEVGMKFTSSADGYISGFRYYKGIGAQGLHTGNLWSITGINLASAVFTDETASGWQTATLTNPVAINANTIYVVSYYSPHGDFVKTVPYFTADFTNGTLTALGWTESQPNGVYRYSPFSVFPNNNAFVGSSNFWADVFFTTTAPDITPPEVVSVIPLNNAGSIPVSNNISAIFSELLDPLTINSNTFLLTGTGSVPVEGTITYSNGTATFTPVSFLAGSETYVATLKGGTTGPRVKDLAGNALAADFSWNFTTGSLPKTLNITVFIQGLYNGGGTMRKANDASGNHFGLPLYPANTADLITIELHNTIDYSLIALTAGNIILNTSGQASLTIPPEINGSYYITIRHRNSVAITSAIPISFAGDVMNYNFVTPAKAFGGNMLQLPDGHSALFCGDINGDGLVDSIDMTLLAEAASGFLTGYLPEDIDGNGIVDSDDMILLDNNANNHVAVIHP
jgi:large repetitive protein